ncbi:MAG: oxidoreductase [Acidimicrobiaceae bacterium]|jgi:3-hydroxyisobutyrate dehydrogenase-like beta-hydroxyacid dehydrogenase|nr:oxidoreductase [Acidimicrobiaceae bacterium]MDP6480499.1 NAD(P)-dependent oxidoreductase [Acidimicrobiales bacterium]MDP6697274.1 NAD(P)-dependent oxidoreductase [Acidimicrobiales bacterium]|tara:strand:- start:13591 stop:14469 length:879 start_codon:yes stop_codon:yes gene_type:complete
MARCAFIGLGVMGYPMAGHLQLSGHETTVYNRTRSKAEAWVGEHGGAMAATPAEAAEGADAVMMCVGNDDDVRSVVHGDEGVLAGLAATEGPATLVDHTTASAELARELAGATGELGAGFVDAPVSGGQAGAENGQLSIMCGGDPEVFEGIRPVMDAYARATVLVGPVGHGQLTKMVNQICIGGLIQGLAEALDFARRAGLDLEQVLAAISKGASGSWQMDNRARTMLDRHFDHGFAIDWMRKDFGIVFDEAARLGASLPFTQLADQNYARLQEQGHGRWDTSAVIELLRED